MKASGILTATLFGLALLCHQAAPAAAETPALAPEPAPTVTEGLAPTRPLFVPVAVYDVLSTDDQTVHAPGAGLIVQNGESLFVATYTQSIFTQAPDSYQDKTYHAIETLYDGAAERHRVVALVKSASDRPFVGGWNTFQAAAVYGYEVYRGPGTSVVVGGGLAVSDFGIETPSGETWPLLPVPFVRVNQKSRWTELSLDFITGPNLKLTVAPESDLRAVADVRVDQLRDERDLIYDVSLQYRVVSVGFKNDTFSFDPADADDSLEGFYYAAYASIDLVLLSLTGGYAFDSLLQDGHETYETGDGYFVAVQGLIPLGGGSE